MKKLSVIIITLNEEKNIGRCIDSVQDIADEIIVLDSFSKDMTEAICMEKGVTFFQHAFDGYIEQKNRALGMAKFDYVLSIDADEAISPELKKSIAEVKENQIADAYTMNRLTYYCGKWIRHSGWYPDTKLRLVLRNKAVWEGINPHDRMSVIEGSTIKHLKGDILHYSYYSISDHVAQANNFTTILANELYRKGKKGSWWRVIFSPISRFLNNYVVNAGFLDGYYGFVICSISAFATYIKYLKLRQLNKEGV
jgi:glycosyltransferase involved in cell wall biosynthesis